MRTAENAVLENMFADWKGAGGRCRGGGEKTSESSPQMFG